MRAVIYCRVSSQEQTSNLSLPVQERACRDYCGREQMTVDNVFIERGESAKTTERSEFRRLIAYCRDQRPRPDAVIVYALTRFSRNSADHHAIRALLRTYNISLRSVTEPIDESPAGRFMEGVLAAMAQYENESKAERSVAGMKAAAEQGRWIWHPPLGYLATRSRPSLVEDPERARLVRWAFERVAEGCSVEDTVKRLRRLGLKTRRGALVFSQQVHKMLRNPVYTGLIVCQAWGGVEYRGDFPALVDEELFRRVQMALRSRRETPITRHSKHEDFPLRRFVSCATCGRPMTGGWSRGKLGRRYAYYNCQRNCVGQTVSKAALETAFVELAGRLVPSRGYLRLLRQLVLNAWATERAEVAGRRKSQYVKLEVLRRKASVLDDRFIYQSTIDEATYTRERDQLREEILLTEMDLADAQVEEIDVEGILASAEDIISNASALWKEGTLDQRERLQRLLFPEGLKWDGEAFRTPTTCLSYYQLAPAPNTVLENGVSDGDRTRDNRSHSPALYQLSYTHHTGDKPRL
jgi:site-specific DNA recombinase